MPRELFLILGSAGAGKSTTARSLARELDADWLQIDTVWISLRAALPPDDPRREGIEIGRALHAMDRSAEEIVELHLRGSATICEALRTVLDFQLVCCDRVVADGAWLLPEFVRQLSFPDTAVHAVVLHEADAVEVKRAMDSRRGDGGTMPWQSLSAEVAWRHGNWMAEQARQWDIPIVAALPRETLLARTRAALGLGAR
jgi:2-phosphoglycerate kinase